MALVLAAQPASAAPAAPRVVRLAAGPAAFPPDVLRAAVAATGCRVRVVPPLPSGALPRAGVDLIEMRGDDAGGLMAAGRLAVIDEPGVTGLGDVPGSLRDAVRDPGGSLRAIPYLWSPQLLLASTRAFGTQPPTSLRALFSRRQASRTALPDSPLELALAARYLGIGDPFALARDELTSAREVVAPASRLLHLYADAAQLRALFRRGEIDLAVGNPATLGDQRAGVVAVLPSEGTIATERVLGIVSGSPRGGLRAAHRRRAARAACPGRALARARVDAGAQRNVRHARGGGLQERCERALSRTLANSAVAVHPVAADGVTGWPEWVGEWVLLHS